jgi:uncharacterized membrane protein
MTLKQYQRTKLAFVVMIAIIISQSIISKNFLIPTATLIISVLILAYFRRKVKEVMSDERDYATGGRSALLAMQIYSWIAVIFMFILYAFRDLNPAYEPISMTLAFSTCILMLLYAAIFRYNNRVYFTNRKIIYTILISILFLVLAVITVRVFSGEDDWICKDGQWIEHGKPSFPAPKVECK